MMANGSMFRKFGFGDGNGTATFTCDRRMKVAEFTRETTMSVVGSGYYA